MFVRVLLFVTFMMNGMLGLALAAPAIQSPPALDTANAYPAIFTEKDIAAIQKETGVSLNEAVRYLELSLRYGAHYKTVAALRQMGKSWEQTYVILDRARMAKQNTVAEKSAAQKLTGLSSAYDVEARVALG